MGNTLAPDHLLAERGTHQSLDGHVVTACFARDGATCAFATADGTLHLAPRAGPWRAVQAHDGGLLALAPDASRGGFVSGGDDGGFLRTTAEGEVTAIARFGSKWVEQVASHADPKAGLLACSVGKRAHVFDAQGGALKVLDHPSTVTGLAFDAKGKRVAASHYNGASLWFVAAKTDSARALDWKGSHTGVVIHPAGEALVTTMQENALHGWRLVDGQHMRMSGYPTKTESLSFSRTGKWLASSGAESIVLWPFHSGGPMGKAPTELATAPDGVICTRVACHPERDLVAAGFSDGTVVAVDIPTARVLPLLAPGRGSVSALAWSGDGAVLALGSESGFAALLDLSER